MRNPALAWPLLLAALAATNPGCLCSSEPTDEERLMQQLDTTKVHVYVALKVALTSGADDETTAEARKQAQALFEKLSKSRSADGAAGESGSIGVGDAVGLAKTLWDLRETGAKIARGEAEDSGGLIAAMLAQTGASSELVAAIDTNGEHAILLLVLSVLKAHPRSPVPVPEEIVLYEAWKTDPSKVQIPGAPAPLHAVKAWVYGTNGYCDLGEAEAAAAEQIGLEPGQVAAGMKLLGFKGGAAVEDLTWVGPALEMIGHGATAICNLDRGDDPKARAAVKRFTASARKAGLAGEELEFLETYVECGDDQLEAGQARLKKLLAARGGQLADHEDLQMLGAYCDAAGTTSNETLRKVVLASKLAGIAFQKAREAKAAEEMEKTEVYQAVEDVAKVSDAIGGGALPGSVDDVKDKAGGLLDKIKGAAEGAD